MECQSFVGWMYGEEWVIYSSIIAALDFGELDYASEDVNTVKIKFVYTNATMKRLIKPESEEGIFDSDSNGGGDVGFG